MFFTVLASAAASVITGTALVATRSVVQQADGLSIATLRYLVAAACLLPLVPIYCRISVSFRDIFPIAGLGILYFCFFPWCISSAMQFTTASNGAIVLACTPAATLLLGQLAGSEHWSMRKGFGVAFAIFGAATAIGHGGLGFGHATWRGDFLMVIATLLGAFYAVFSKPYLKRYSPLIVTAIAMGAGALGLSILWSTVDFPHTGIPVINSAGWLSILYIGVVGGALSFFLYAWALGRTSATSMMILLPLNPISALFTGAIFLHEALSFNLFAGLVLVIIGIILVVGVPDSVPDEVTSGVLP
jgi:drug/metabolite transporter (DMT)-like permease